MTQRNDPTGAQFEIAVADVPRTYRDDKAIALEAAKVLKERTPALKVCVRDMRDNAMIVVAWESGKAIVAN
jgi:hypothetical protein